MIETKKIYEITPIVYTYIITAITAIIILYSIDLIDTEKKITYESIGGALITIIGLILFYQRLKKQQKQINIQINQLKIQTDQLKIQINQRVDDRFNSAINLLGSSETSARTGAIYALYELAIEEEKYLRQIAQIMCSHIRSKTNEAEYKKTHSKRPSNEIQTTINLLFKEKEEGLYTQDFARVDGFPKANLSHAYLMGADFTDAWCRGVDFTDAQCKEVSFTNAQCQGVDFRDARCQEANFVGAKCQGADFTDAWCQGANFRDARCQVAGFSGAQCQKAGFFGAQCQKADFTGAQCHEANFKDAQCQGAVFMEAQCKEVSFTNAQCQGADFRDARCQEANFVGAECQGANFEGAKFDRPHDIQIKGEISDKAIKAIEDAKPYLDNSWYEKMQKIIKENKGKDPEFRTYGP